MKFFMIKSIFAFPFTGIHQSMTGCTEQIEEICQAQCENDCPIYLQVGPNTKISNMFLFNWAHVAGLGENYKEVPQLPVWRMVFVKTIGRRIYFWENLALGDSSLSSVKI